MDFLNPSTFANGHGAIAGLCNVAPYAARRLFNLCMRLKDRSNGVTSTQDQVKRDGVTDTDLLKETLALQGVIAQADRVLSVAGISGTKYVIQKFDKTFGSAPRRPLPPIDPKKGEELYGNEFVKALLVEEEKAEKLAKK